MTAPLLEIRHLVKDYQALRPLRVGVLTVAPGRVVSLTGFDAMAAEMPASHRMWPATNPPIPATRMALN